MLPAMRTLLITFYLLISVTVFSQQITKLDSTIWYNDYETALSIAKANNVPILIVFSGSDWCKPCIKLREQILVKPAFTEWAKANVVCLTVDFPKQKKNRLSPQQQKKNDAMAEKFNPNGVFPLVLLVNKNGKVIGNKSYEDVAPELYVKELKELIK